MTGLVIAGCGSSGVSRTTTQSAQPKRNPVTPAIAPAAASHPQVVEPVAGQAAPGETNRSAPAQPPAASTVPASDPPTGPASDISAPAKGAPTDAEIRAAIARFQLAVARYHLDRLNLSSSLLAQSQVPSGQYNVSIASVYTDYGDPVACGGILHVSTLGVANKTLPCGTEVIFRYGGRAIRVPVIDRGPYIAGREWDLTGATAEALGFPGLGAIQWRLG